ncbi:glutathione gamma-glutamylcysteinyltransferase 1 [Ziziphus jujuba]|uniref:glutathione gamma-glutamylcysteinyltransferase n=1 Tax=Ziziphus jujuba TaxID=326968 RepID=A0ABM3IE96_ZIZJJ|nr:glutathione gamma-glutamylcysteinyltransferase 1 [Ziziphus jujuba]
MSFPGLPRIALPSPPAIDFASIEGKRLFTEALGNGTMEGFFKLISYYQSQTEINYCGVGTLAMVLNTLAIDPPKKWKGRWSWYVDSMLDCGEPFSNIKSEGISFGNFVYLAHCNGAQIEAFRTSESTVDDFRKSVILSTCKQDCHVVSLYHRTGFKQVLSLHSFYFF